MKHIRPRRYASRYGTSHRRWYALDMLASQASEVRRGKLGEVSALICSRYRERCSASRVKFLLSQIFALAIFALAKVKLRSHAVKFVPKAQVKFLLRQSEARCAVKLVLCTSEVRLVIPSTTPWSPSPYH